MKTNRAYCFTAIAATLTLLAAGSLHGQVTQKWIKSYNGLANSNDRAKAIAVDGSGNVIVTGNSSNAISSNDLTNDYYTAKYDAATGVLLWEKRYNGPANSIERANGLAVDASGNVVVTGESYNANSNSDYYTAKYSAANGALIWEKRYNGTGNSHDHANSVAVDAAGNVIVTGDSTSNLNNSDYYTAKYSAATGNQLWAKRYNGPADSTDVAYSMAVDAAGNVAVTGYSSNGTDNDYYTAKYAAATGALLWEKRYNGTGNSDDDAFSVAVDASGNVAVTGVSHNGSNEDYYTAKYAAADGALLWEKRYNGPGNGDDWAYSVAVDAAGNVVVTGESPGTGGSADYYTAKYAAADGALLWEKRYNGPGNGNDYAFSVAVDASGNVVVTGQSFGNGTGNDYYTAKYAAATGALLWEKRYNGTGINNDEMFNGAPFASKLALTRDGGAVVTGQSSNGANFDYATVRYSVTLTLFQQWKLTHLGDANAPDEGDTDSDGLRTLLEYATGGDPLVPGPLPSGSSIAGKTAITFSRNTAATDVTLTVQGSDDLSTWTDLARSTAGATMVSLVAGVDVTENGVGAVRTVEVRDLFLMSDPMHPRRFLRLHAAP
jgi:uncharacterized delta-60 repeat protein